MKLWLLGLSAAYSIALNGTMVMPVVVLATSKLEGYDEGLATVVASAELAGIAIYGLFLAKIIRLPSRAVAFAGVLAVLLGELSSFWAHSPAALSTARFVAGLGEGAIFSLVSTSLASLANAERLWGAVSVIGGSAMGILLFVVSMTTVEAGGPIVFLLLASFTALLAPLLGLISKRSGSMPLAAEHSRLNSPKMILTIGIVFIVYAVQAGQWAICGYLGDEIGLSSGQVGLYLALSSLIGFFGAIIPSMARDKSKRFPSVMLGFLIMAGSVYCLFNILSPVVFFVAQVLVNIGFYIITPFVTGVLTENDLDGSLMSRVLVIAIAGAAIGTALAGPIFFSLGPAAVGWACLVPLALAAICSVSVLGHLHRSHPALANSEIVE